MAVKEVKDMGASVLARLKKQAKETEINYQTCLQLTGGMGKLDMDIKPFLF